VDIEVRDGIRRGETISDKGGLLMTKLKLREVRLPGGDVVHVSDSPEGWWNKANASGFVDPHQIAPDPRNPRRVMNPARRVELEESIAANGVRQALVLTPKHMAPWAQVAKEHTDCYFLDVSGHRRREASINKSVGAVPVMIRIYPDEKAHRMDVSLLNKGQDDLSALEEGHEILMLQELGWKVNELCASFGYQAPQLYDRIHLTRLAPDIQQLLDPDLPRKKRLGVTLGGKLGGIPAPTADELEEACENYGKTVARE
jgi:ParB-like chromosome segregation protein Spo0J